MSWLRLWLYIVTFNLFYIVKAFPRNERFFRTKKLLEEHKSKGTVPKDLLLPKKKALFEDGQGTLDAIFFCPEESLIARKSFDNIKQIESDYI